MLQPFEVFVPTRVTFGCGEVVQIGRLARAFGRRALLVTGKNSARTNGQLGRVLEELRQSGVEPVTFDQVTPNPRTTTADEGARLARAESVSLVIALGGGSVIDAGKAIAVGAVSGRPIGEHIAGGHALPESTLPLIAIPTTAGSGSELSRGAILTDAATGRKGGLRGEACLPTLALIDPELTVGMSADLTAETGFDAWSHALETFLSRRANPFTEALSISAMERIVRFLPHAVRSPFDVMAREQMSAASSMMGWNLGLATTCLPHRLQYPVGAKTDSAHARGVAALHGAWLRQLAPFAADKLAKVAAILAGRYGGSGVAGDDCADLEAAFLADIGMTTSLRDLGITEKDCEQLAAEVTGDVKADPGPSDAAAILRIYQQSV